MTKKIGHQTAVAATDTFIYVENNANASMSIGSDLATGTFNVNTQATAGVVPSEASSNIAIDPSANGDIVFQPNGTGETDVAAGNFVVLLGNAYVGTSTPNNPYDIAVERTVAGNIGQSIQNLSANAAAAVNVQHIVEVGGGDAYSLYSVNGGGTWSLGLDNSDSDKYKATSGSSPSGGIEFMSLDSAGLASVFGTNNTTAATTVQSGSGALNVTSTNGALTVNSGTGALGISTDAAATTVSLATGAAAKTVTLGSTNTTSSLALRYGTSDFTLASATGTVISALDTGEVTKPLQPAFYAYKNGTASNVTGDGTQYNIATFTETFDQGSDFNNTTGVFTAPVTGIYEFGMSVQILQGSGSTFWVMGFRYNATNITHTQMSVSPLISGIIKISGSLQYQMTAGDTMAFYVTFFGGALSVDVDGSSVNNSFVFGRLVC